MIYPYTCPSCDSEQNATAPISEGPPAEVRCHRCGDKMRRVWTAPMFICPSDPDFVKPDKRVFDTVDRQSEVAKEAAFQRHIDERRSLVRQAGHNPNAPRMTYSVPADLFHGKIRESGDKAYWDDPSNLKKHKSCKVD